MFAESGSCGEFSSGHLGVDISHNPTDLAPAEPVGGTEDDVSTPNGVEVSRDQSFLKPKFTILRDQTVNLTLKTLVFLSGGGENER